MRAKLNVMLMACATVLPSPAIGAMTTVWENEAPLARLIAPDLSGPASKIVTANLDCYLNRFYGWTFPPTDRADGPGLYLVVGNGTNNRVLKELVAQGLNLDLASVGEEGFRILTHDSGDRHYIIVAAQTPLGLRHGCQELVFYRLAATPSRVQIEWPLDVQMRPAFAYRSIYMLPCWSAYDSIESWRRVLKFNSELTLNRNWFWLAGFPLLEEYGGQYTGTALADVNNVRGLIDLCRSEGMKFYIGGGWFTFHHEPAAQGSIERGAQYYLDLFKLLPEAEGIYLEPPGEGYEVPPEVWRPRTLAMQRMMETIWRCRPEFEFALAIGSFNNTDYQRTVHEIDDQRIFWWWCWGDPLRDNALDQHPLVVRWHTVVRMSNFHGSSDPPQPSEQLLTGFATSYDPGMGYGNPWNGWAKMGVNESRNFHPYTMPYFSHQYWFRERCWNVNMTREQFAQRLARRLFDADMPAEAIAHYLTLAVSCPNPAAASAQDLDAIEVFVNAHWDSGTPRNRDTLARMREAVEGIRQFRTSASASSPHHGPEHE